MRNLTKTKQLQFGTKTAKKFAGIFVSFEGFPSNCRINNVRHRLKRKGIGVAQEYKFSGFDSVIAGRGVRFGT